MTPDRAPPWRDEIAACLARSGASGSEQSNTVHIGKKCLHDFAILP
jgi:hypothetical protein